ncbi:MAG TPA: hypothetical protein VF789_34600 [Thermoanaerobaculia bacterium]
MKRLIVIAFAAAALSLANPAAASVPGEPQDAEAFRGQLAGFMESLQGLSQFDSTRMAEARARLAQLSPADLATIEKKFSAVPNWQALPGVLAELARDQEPEPAASAETPPEAFRTDMLVLISRFRKFSPLMEPEYDARLAGTAEKIKDLPPEALERLQEEYLRRASSWKLQLTTGNPAPSAAKDIFDDIGDTVGGIIDDIGGAVDDVAAIADFVSDFFDDVAGVFDQIASLPGTIQGYFNGLFSSIQSLLTQGLDAILSIVPETPEEAFALLGLDVNDAQWFNGVAGSLPVLDPPCPAIGTDIPGIGEVGTTRAELVCKRGIDWLAGMVYELAPGDVYNTPFKALAAAFAYPVNYLCLCMESQAALAGAEGDAAHQAFLAERADATLSTRATETSVTDLRTALRDLDGDVAKVETKLDVLEAKSDEIAATGDEQQRFLEAFRDLVLRVNIEENLTQNPSDVVALFQLPKAFGGYLDLARAIVADTLRMNQAARQPVGNAMKDLDQGDASLRVGDFQKAYQAYQRAYREAVKP